MNCPGEVKELFKVLYGLSGSEASVLYQLCHEGGKASDIAEEMGRDRSTVQRYLSKLHSAGLIKRESRVEEGKKGRHYYYHVPSSEALKQKVRERMDEWEEEKLQALEELGG